MAQPQRLIQLPLVGAILLSLLAGVFLTRRWFLQSDASDKVVKHHVPTPPAEVLKYWTADKMRKARPAKLPQVDNQERGTQRSPQTPRSSEA